MVNDLELQSFANDLYDTLACNTNMCTQEELLLRYGYDTQIDCSTNTITFGDFQINITRKNN